MSDASSTSSTGAPRIPLAQQQQLLLARRREIEIEEGFNLLPDRPAPMPRAKRPRAPFSQPTEGSRRSPRVSGGGGASLAAPAAAAGAATLATPPEPRAPRLASLPAAPAAGSARALPTRFEWLRAASLGRFIPLLGRSPKLAVMCAAHAAGTPPTFNKYAGVQEFADGVVLFVNLFAAPGMGAAGAAPTMRNTFSEGGRIIRWFGSDRADETTPALLRLRYHKTGCRVSEAGTVTSGLSGVGGGVIEPCPVVLAVRLDPSLPYIYCGALEFVAHKNPGRVPCEFSWRLSDYEDLVAGVQSAIHAGTGGAQKQRGAALEELSTMPEEYNEATEEAGGGGAGAGAGAGAGSGKRRPYFAAILRAGALSDADLKRVFLGAQD